MDGSQPRFILGITGTIGSGKSMVGEMLAAEGIPILDSDKVVHQLLDHDPAVQAGIAERFGPSVFTQRPGSPPAIDRTALAKLVFDDEPARKDLEGIVHPATISYCQDWANKQTAPIVSLLVPLLFEANQRSRYDQIWTVICDEALLRERLKARNAFSDAEIDQRLAAQLSQNIKASRADRIIDNSGTIENTRRQVLSCLTDLREKCCN